MWSIIKTKEYAWRPEVFRRYPFAVPGQMNSTLARIMHRFLSRSDESDDLTAFRDARQRHPLAGRTGSAARRMISSLQ